MLRGVFSKGAFFFALVVQVVVACNGRGFSGDGPEGGAAGEDNDDATGGTAARGGATSGGGEAGDGDDDATGGTSARGGATTGGATTGGGSGATAGSAEGGTTATGGSSGTGPGGFGGAGSGGMAGASANGGSGGSGGSNECADALSCTVCCDERYPDAHLNVAGTFYNCGCAQPCYTYCSIEFCGSTYYWSDDCIVCMLQAPISSPECVDADAACDDSELCSAYRACIVACS